jgi:hypothetical protein
MYLTIAQFNVLGAMNTLRLKGDYFIDLSDVHGQIVTSLVGRGYIAPRSAAPDEHVYRMTGLGLDAYNLFKVPRLYRKDGLCPRCGKRPRQDYGHRLGNYCVECAAEVRHKHYKAKATLRDPNKPCARCGATPRHVTPAAVSSYCIDCYRERVREKQQHRRERLSADAPCVRCGATPRYVSGRRITPYCHDCFKAQNRDSRQARQQRLLEQIAAGNVPTCTAPGCNRPVRHTDNHVSAHCLEHDRDCNRRSYHKVKDERKRRRIAHRLAQLRVVPPAEFQQAGD